MSDPTTIGIESRIFTGVFDDRDKIMAGSAFTGFFAQSTPVVSLHADDFDSQVLRGSKKISALVPRDGNISRHLGSLVKTRVPPAFSEFSRRFPLGLEYASISENQLRKMIPGELPYQPLTKQERAQWHLVNGEMPDVFRSFADMDNLLASQSMLTGKQDSIIGTSNEADKYNWQRSSGNTITVGTSWSDPSAPAVNDLDGAAERVDRYGYIKPSIVGMNPKDYDNFKKNTQVKDEADNRRFETVKIEGIGAPPDHAFMIQNGWVLRGRLVTPKGYELYIYTTQDFYDDANGDKVDLMTEGTVMITAPMAKRERYYGPSVTLDLTTAQIMHWNERLGVDIRNETPPPDRVPAGILPRDSIFLWLDESASSIDIWFQHSPVFKPTQTDAIATLEGVN